MTDISLSPHTTLSVAVDIADDAGTFDGTLDALAFNSETKTWQITDGVTGKVRAQGALDTDRNGREPVLWAKADADGDGKSDPLTFVTGPDGMLTVVAAVQSEVAEGKDINGDGTMDLMFDLDRVNESIKGAMASQYGAAVANAAVLLKGADTSVFQQGKVAATAAQHWGFDLSAIDPSVKPGDDFYGFANGSWQKNAVILPERWGAGSTADVYYRTNEDVRTLVDELVTTSHAPGTEAQKIRDFYQSYMDMDAINAAGLGPFKADMDYINAIQTTDDLVRAFGQGGVRGWSSPMDFGIGPDLKNPDSRTVYTGFGGLVQGDGSRDYYLEDGEKYDKIREAYTNFMAYTFEYAGADPDTAKRQAQQVLELEKRIAALHWTNEAYRDPNATYNPVSMEQLRASSPNFNWDLLLSAGGIPPRDQIIAVELGDFQKMADLIAETPIDVWKQYLLFQKLNGSVNVMPQAYQDARHNMYIKPKYGREEQTPREQAATGALNDSLGEAIGKYYVERHFPPSSKAIVDGVVDNLRSAYRQTFEANSWMGDQTRAKALLKLDELVSEVGYPKPENWRDYSGLDIQPGDAAGNMQRLRAWDNAEAIRKLDEPVNRGEWISPPQEVNAHFIPTRNKIVFMAGYLQPPQFDPNSDPAVIYGAIGATVGHEMGHAFDDKGSQYDETGTLQNWWTDQDRAAFEDRAKGLIDQYAAYVALPESVDEDGNTTPALHVNGELTLGENIGDLVGLDIAYKAYKLALNGQEAPVIDGLTGDQRFFLAFAQSWREKSNEGSIRSQVLTDPHSPSNLRAQTVRNYGPWYDAFNIQPGDALYLPPEERVYIWDGN